MAAIKSYLWELDWLLGHGANMELKGSTEGRPLMVACAHGRKEVVKLLVRRRARVAYVKHNGGGHNGGGDNGPEATVVRNALEYAEAYPDIVRWLLIGRHTD